MYVLKIDTIHCVTRSQVLLYLESSVNLGELPNFFPALFPFHVHHQQVLRGSSAAPQKKHTPALSSPLIKAAENVPGSRRSQPGIVKCSALQCQSSRIWIQAHIISILLQGPHWQGDTSRLSQ